jgi:hypothetical protein
MSAGTGSRPVPIGTLRGRILGGFQYGFSEFPKIPIFVGSERRGGGNPGRDFLNGIPFSRRIEMLESSACL